MVWYEELTPEQREWPALEQAFVAKISRLRSRYTEQADGPGAYFWPGIRRAVVDLHSSNGEPLPKIAN